jgi:hypothetical protein
MKSTTLKELSDALGSDLSLHPPGSIKLLKEPSCNSPSVPRLSLSHKHAEAIDTTRRPRSSSKMKSSLATTNSPLSNRFEPESAAIQAKRDKNTESES